jgi:hypothetical protein
MGTFHTRTGSLSAALLAGALAIALSSPQARAQETTAQPAEAPPAPAAPETPAPAPAPAPAPDPAPAPPPAPLAQAPATSTAGTPAETVTTAPAKSEEFKKMDPPAIWFRLDNKLQNRAEPKKLNDIQNGAEVDVLFSGKVHQYVGWQADFVATFGNQNADGHIAGDAAILDLIAKFDLHDSFNVWFGRMLVPSDRSNFSGPWFMSAWNYPGFYLPGPPIGPMQGPFGRNDGATVWGQFLGGYLKYYAGAFDLHDDRQSPLISTRVNLSLLNPEPGYYHSSTYYGGKDIVALGFSYQNKNDGSVQPTPMMPDPMFVPGVDDYSAFSIDLLAEKKLGDAGTATVEGAFYKFTGDFNPAKDHFYALASYLFPTEIGIGRFQPLFRYQQATANTPGAEKWRLYDAAVSYVVDEYAMRIALNFQHADIGGIKGNALQLGIQIQK